MSYQEVTGNLFDFGFDAVAHGVNCQGLMGAGIAKQFRERYPQMFWTYHDLCSRNLLSLGQVHVDRPSDEHPDLTIYNVASQILPGPNADLMALLLGLEFVRFDAERAGIKTLGIPQIGCGIGGLSWKIVGNLISDIFEPSKIDLTVVNYEA